MQINRILTPWLVAGAFLVSTSALAVTPNSATSSPTTMPSSPQTTATQTEFTPQQVKNIQKIVHDYLINNPQVLVEASQALQKQAQEKQQQYAMQAIEKNKQQLFNDPVSPVAGNPNGNVTLIEFFDYQCGHCKAMNKIIQSIVAKNKNLRVVLKELPIFGSNSQLAAKVAAEKVERDRQLNLARQQVQAKKAQQAELLQIIQTNQLKGFDGDKPFNFADGTEVKTVNVNNQIHKQLVAGTLRLARFKGGYALITDTVVEKVMQRDASVLIPLEVVDDSMSDEDKEYYAKFEIPDDLVW